MAQSEKVLEEDFHYSSSLSPWRLVAVQSDNDGDNRRIVIASRAKANGPPTNSRVSLYAGRLYTMLGVLFSHLTNIFRKEAFEVPLHPVYESTSWMLTLKGGVSTWGSSTSSWSKSGPYKAAFRLWRRASEKEAKKEGVEKANPEWGTSTKTFVFAYKSVSLNVRELEELSDNLEDAFLSAKAFFSDEADLLTAAANIICESHGGCRYQDIDSIVHAIGRDGSLRALAAQVSKVCGTGTSTSKSLEFLQLQEETIKTILAVRTCHGRIRQLVEKKKEGNKGEDDEEDEEREEEEEEEDKNLAAERERDRKRKRREAEDEASETPKSSGQSSPRKKLHTAEAAAASASSSSSGIFRMPRPKHTSPEKGHKDQPRRKDEVEEEEEYPGPTRRKTRGSARKEVEEVETVDSSPSPPPIPSTQPVGSPPPSPPKGSRRPCRSSIIPRMGSDSEEEEPSGPGMWEFVDSPLKGEKTKKGRAGK